MVKQVDVIEYKRYSNGRNNHNGYGCPVLGYSPGFVMAMIISYHHYESIIWALLHACLSWIYIIYFVITGVQ